MIQLRYFEYRSGALFGVAWHHTVLRGTMVADMPDIHQFSPQFPREAIGQQFWVGICLCSD